MKKVLSVAMASAMVLGMGANAFAIQYSTGSSETASWPSNFKFAGSLFVTDEDGNIVESTITDLNGKTRVDFQPGDTIWMPLYADNQRVYEATGTGNSAPAVSARTEYVAPSQVGAEAGAVVDFTYEDTNNKVVYYYVANPTTANVAAAKTAAEAQATANGSGWRTAQITSAKIVKRDGSSYKTVNSFAASDWVTTVDKTVSTPVAFAANSITSIVPKDAQNWANDGQREVTVTINGVNFDRTATLSGAATALSVNISVADLVAAGVINAESDSYEHTVASVTVTGTINAANANAATAVQVAGGATTNVAVSYPNTTSVLNSNFYVKVDLPALSAVSTDLGTIIGSNADNTDSSAVYADNYHYTGNIDKNWSINLIEEDNGVADLIEKAELYKADEVDYLSYHKYTEEIVPNGVYLKVTLKDSWKLADDADLKYYVYVADNKSNTNVTNKVWVSGTYAASYRYVDFTWTNDASKAGVWKVKDGENGVAVFDFADKAFFQVKMYSKESMYLDLSTAYDKAIAGDFSEADGFFKFDNENANFSRTGTLILVSDDSSLIPYEITENGYNKVDAEYVTDFVVAHTNEKVSGFVFETKQLGNYVLSTEEVEVEEDDKDDNNQEVVVPDTDNKETENNSKPNPSTGAEDFVGLAVSLAVVSVAAAGALALKK